MCVCIHIYVCVYTAMDDSLVPKQSHNCPSISVRMNHTTIKRVSAPILPVVRFVCSAHQKTNKPINEAPRFYYPDITWWRQHMETFSALLAICAGNSPVPGEFPAQRPVTRSFDVFFNLRLNKRLGKHSWGWWFETPLRSLWRHCNYQQEAHARLQFTLM